MSDTNQHLSNLFARELRDYASRHGDYPPGHVVWQAAAEIERLVEQYEVLNSRYHIEIKNYEEAEQRAERLEEQLEAFRTALESVADCVHIVKPGYDGHPVIVVRQPGTALDAAVQTAKDALAAYPASERQEAAHAWPHSSAATGGNVSNQDMKPEN